MTDMESNTITNNFHDTGEWLWPKNSFFDKIFRKVNISFKSDFNAKQNTVGTRMVKSKLQEEREIEDLDSNLNSTCTHNDMHIR